MNINIKNDDTTIIIINFLFELFKANFIFIGDEVYSLFNKTFIFIFALC